MGRARHSPNRRETLRYSTWQAAGESHLSKLSQPIKYLAAVGQDKLKKPDQFSTYQVLFRRPSETLKVPPFSKLLSPHNLEVTLAAAGPLAFRRKPPLQSCLFLLLTQISNKPSVGLKQSAHSCTGNGVGSQNIGKRFLIPDMVSTSIMFWDVVFLRISQKAAHSSLQHSLSCTCVLPTDCTPYSVKRPAWILS